MKLPSLPQAGVARAQPQPTGDASADPAAPGTLARRLIDRYDKGGPAESGWSAAGEGEGAWRLGAPDRTLDREEFPIGRFDSIAGFDGDPRTISQADLTAGIAKLFGPVRRAELASKLDDYEADERSAPVKRALMAAGIGVGCVVGAVGIVLEMALANSLAAKVILGGGAFLLAISSMLYMAMGIGRPLNAAVFDWFRLPVSREAPRPRETSPPRPPEASSARLPL